ncbi:MAG: chalcone isomerase family protein, partial [Bacteroidetes bacterium]|nr:chalcone isomerase family protein [Bacteroidota bacterium]
MEDPQSGSTEELIQAVLTEEKAKQITMDFVRDVGSSQIQDAYRDGFEENATADELKSIESEVEQFAGYYANEIQENDQLVLRWLPDGTIIAIIKGEEQPPITNPTFARVLWTIWFGPDSIVDPEELVALYSVEE